MTHELFLERFNEFLATWKPPVDFQSKEVVDFWYSRLKRIPDDIFIKACDKALDELEFFPTMAFFIRYYKEEKTERPNGW